MCPSASTTVQVADMIHCVHLYTYSFVYACIFNVSFNYTFKLF